MSLPTNFIQPEENGPVINVDNIIYYFAVSYMQGDKMVDGVDFILKESKSLFIKNVTIDMVNHMVWMAQEGWKDYTNMGPR